RCHGMRAGIAGMAPECAIAAVVATKIRQGKKYLAGIGDDSRFESRAGKLCRREQGRQHVVVRSQQPTSRFTRDRLRAGVSQLSSRRGQRIWKKGGHTSLHQTRFIRTRRKFGSALATIIADPTNPCPFVFFREPSRARKRNVRAASDPATYSRSGEHFNT